MSPLWPAEDTGFNAERIFNSTVLWNLIVIMSQTSLLSVMCVKNATKTIYTTVYSLALTLEFIAMAFVCNYWRVIAPSRPLSLNYMQLLTSNYTGVSINSGCVKLGFNMWLVRLLCLYAFVCLSKTILYILPLAPQWGWIYKIKSSLL